MTYSPPQWLREIPEILTTVPLTELDEGLFGIGWDLVVSVRCTGPFEVLVDQCETSKYGLNICFRNVHPDGD